MLDSMTACTTSSALLVDTMLWLTHLFSNISIGEICGFVPKPVEFKDVKPEKMMVDGEEREKTSHYKPRVKAKTKKTPSKVIDDKKSYNLRPYSYSPRGISPLLFYSESSKEITMITWMDIPIAVLFLLAIVAHALLFFKLDTKMVLQPVILKRYLGCLLR